MTGSSARKLKRGGINLLAGRAWRCDLFPLTSHELGSRFDLERYLLVGGLPAVYLSPDPLEELHAYVEAYLKEEVMEEALVRRFPAFTRFLHTVAICEGQIINYTNIGNDAQVPPSTVREYFGILEDTLLGFSLPAWTRSKKRKAIQTAKFYLFDTGVGNALRGIDSLPRNSDLFGTQFEHFLLMELRAYLGYTRKRESLAYWRSVNGQEVDLLVGEKVAIEIKAAARITNRHRKGLLALKEEGVFGAYYLVSNDQVRAVHDGINQLQWREFLEELWRGDIV
jgi:predicted AAA+ superfamily ATPase